MSAPADSQLESDTSPLSDLQLQDVLKEADALHVSGAHGAAADCLEQVRRSPRLSVQQLKQVTLLQTQYLDRAGRIGTAIEILQEARRALPDDVDLISSEGIARSLADDFAESSRLIELALQSRAGVASWWDVLARNYGRLGQMAAAVQAGTQALTLKDEQTPAPTFRWLRSDPPPPFDPSRPERNIISFSLWGAHPRYLEGAFRNAWMVRDLYPGWTCRFYCDVTVPQQARDALARLGSQLIVSSKPPTRFYEGLFWRFMVWSDPQVDRFLIRDTDSLLSAREKAAVDEWLLSGRSFHVMRDFYGHTDLIHGGMWGGVAGRLPALPDLIATFRPRASVARAIDQVFLRDIVWPLIKPEVVIHDSVFKLFDSQPFPAHAWCSPGFHVGQDFAVTDRYQKGPLLTDLLHA
jgi:hypothetical protein